MKNLGTIVSKNGILKSHEEFMERLADLMNEFGFDSVYADSQKIVFDNSGSSGNATEGLAFDGLNKDSFTGVDSFFSYRNAEPAQYTRGSTQTAQEAPEEPDESFHENTEPTKENPQPNKGRGWGQGGA